MLPGMAIAQDATSAGMKMKTENFDRDPGWHGVNNRSARTHEQATIRQDFGWSKTDHAGGKRGEIGGFISPAGEAAYYAAAIPTSTFEDKISASGTLWVGEGGTHILLGFFNSDTVNEWRTNNTIAMRINARGNGKYLAYVEYCTLKWRAGGDTTPFPHVTDPETGRWSLIGFPVQKPVEWSLTYDPDGNNGLGVVTATIGKDTAICNLEAGHKAEGATFNRIGILNIMKSADSGSEIFIDNLTFNGKTETFDQDPGWDARNNRTTYKSKIIRPLFDFGFSPTNFAGGEKKGELGGQTFRGDCRYPERMGCYGDAVGPLKMDKPIRASGKVTLTRGVTDSTTLFGFYNSKASMRVNEAQDNAIPDSVIGIHIEGPSALGFLFYPVWRTAKGHSGYGRSEANPFIYPDGATHDWVLEYNPDGADGKGQITVTFDDQSNTFDLEEGAKDSVTTFDRFGIVTSWIDGNSQDVFWDDITYTVAQD